MTILYIVLALVVALVLFLFTFYNRLKTIQVRIKASIQEIGNQLKRQADLIPNLVNSAKGFMKHEEKIFTQITDARKQVIDAANSGNLGKIEESQASLDKALSSFRVVLESTPQLQSAPVVQGLMNELRDTADKLMYSRRTLIDLSADYNTTLETIPGVWLAPLFGFKPEKGLSVPTGGEHLEVSSTDANTPKVDL